MKMYKCPNCLIFVTESKINTSGPFKIAICPECQGVLEEACENDCVCNHQNVPGVEKCDICGEYICPVCGGHDVIPISRITGYMSPINAWNGAKKQELMDRRRETL